MALSSWLRSLSNRSKLLLKPVPLASILGLLLLVVFIWEYSTHPEWFDEYAQEETTADGEIDLSGLTPEEQAAIADIDNLNLLFNELGIEPGGVPSVQSLPGDPEEQQNVLRQDLLSLAQPSNPTAASSSPFAEYLEEYQFSPSLPGQDQQGTTSDNLGRPRSAPSPLSLQNDGQSEAVPNRYTNPLTAALQNQNLATNRVSESGTASLGQNGRSQRSATATTAAASQSPDESSTTGSNFEGQFSSEITTIPGVDTPFLPTLPQMSPPPGTTGYTPPATLELMPPLPGRTPPMPGTSSLFPSDAGVPNLSGASSAPNLAAPQVDVSNGYVTPFTPTAPPTSRPITPPAPFSAPRPPGSYTGNGYINTFSNPSAPPN
jgi:hypothetical protein